MSNLHAARGFRISTAVLAGTTALSMLALAGCGSDGDDNGGEGGTDGGNGGELQVTASFYPMTFLAERIGGEHVTVTTLTEPGVDPHDLELSPRQIGRLGQADVIVYLEGLQPAVDEAVLQSGVAHIAEASSFVHAEPGEENDEDDHGHDEDEDDDHGHDEDEDDHGHEDDEHEDEDDDEDGHDGHHDGHDHGEDDPHIWLDPLTYAVAADGVAETLAAADPDNAADYRKNADDLSAELRALDEEFEQGLANREIDTIITTHAAFGYLAERYGLREEAITGLDPESEPSGARMRELHTIAESEGVTTVFFEVLASDAMARTLADDLGLETDVLDPLEGITADSRGADYFEVMRSNLEALQQALGAQQ